MQCLLPLENLKVSMTRQGDKSMIACTCLIMDDPHEACNSTHILPYMWHTLAIVLLIAVRR